MSNPQDSTHFQYSQDRPLDQHGYVSEKREAIESIQQVPPIKSEYEEDDVRTPDWTPGILSRFPWLGFGALIVVLLCTTGAIIVLVFSDRKSQTHWPQRIQPSVILSGLNNVANLCFSLAIANGVAIAWWRKALKGATIEDLHKSWSFSSSVKEAALAGKAFNVIALAALTAKFTIIDGMLMQSATTTYVDQDQPTSISSIRGWANQTFPMTGRQDFILNAIRRDIVVWEDHPSQLPLTAFQDCEGLCFFKVPAAGFVFDCKPKPASITMTMNTSTTFWDVEIRDGTSLNRTKTSTSAKLFNLQFAPEYTYSSDGTTVATANIKMDLAYTQITDSTQLGCSGTIVQNTCTLKPALLNYPVMMQNYTLGTKQVRGISVGVTPGSNSNSASPLTAFDPTLQQQQGFEVIKLLDDVDVGMAAASTSPPLTKLAGLSKALNLHLGGKFDTSMTFEGRVVNIDNTASTWLYSEPSDEQPCAYKFDNPLNPEKTGPGYARSLVASVNQIMFAVVTNAMTNLTATNDVPWQTYTGLLYKDAVHYKTRWAYAAGAIASTLFCILCILPVYWGYWQLGRKVTLGPFEIAHAFRSPMTAQASSGEIEEVVKQVGHNEVQYGYIVAGNAQGVLGVAEPENVARLVGGHTRKSS